MVQARMSPPATASASGARDRAADQLRPVQFTPGFLRNAHSSVLVECGNTRIICTASVEESVPDWMAGKGVGWVTAEYAMLPASTGTRKPRDIKRGQQDGRGVEIQRLIGRSLRAVVNRQALGERSVAIDCDVIDADGGTRCAAITGGYVALHRALQTIVDKGLLPALPLNDSVSAVSAGVVNGEALLDLDYREDSSADVDMNFVMTGSGRLVEVQATAEGATFTQEQFSHLMQMSTAACSELALLQSQACAVVL